MKRRLLAVSSGSLVLADVACQRSPAPPVEKPATIPRPSKEIPAQPAVAVSEPAVNAIA